MEEVVVDKILFRFAICGTVPETFAIKVQSCQKSRRILDVFFALPNFRGPAFQKLYPFYHPYFTARRMEKFAEDTPISPEVLFAHTLNFKPDFKFSRLKFLGGPPSLLGCALANLPQSLAHVKI